MTTGTCAETHAHKPTSRKKESMRYLVIFECSRHAGTKSPALSAFGRGEFTRRGFLGLFYLGEVLDLDLVELLILEVGIGLVPRLRFKIFLKLYVLEHTAMASVDLVSQNAQILGKQSPERFVCYLVGREPFTHFFLPRCQQVDILLLDSVELYRFLILGRLVPVAPVEIIANSRSVKLLAVTGVKFLAKYLQIEQAQPLELVLGKQDVLKIVHIADGYRRLMVLLLLGDQPLHIFALDLGQHRRIVRRIGLVPITLGKIFLQPLLAKRLAVYRLDLRDQYRQLGTGILAKIIIGDELRLPNAHIARLDERDRK